MMQNTVYTQAHTHHANGIRVIPVKADGTKAPALRAWQNHETSTADIEDWFGGLQPRHTAIGIVTGPPSGNLEMVEIEGPYEHEIQTIAQLAQDTGLGELWARLNTGWVEQSPSGGVHWFYRVDGMEVPGNTKLAQAEDRATIAETRGKGGQVVASPTGGHAHDSGRPWARLAGGANTTPTLTADEREQFHTLLGTLDRRPQRSDTTAAGKPALTGLLAQLENAHTPQALADLGGSTPGDDFETKTTWKDLLEPAGWTIAFQRGRTTYWTRPGKNAGISATTGNADDRDRLYVFSSSTDFPTFEPITKFSAYALLEHGGNHSEAARALRSDGYGEPAKIQHPAAASQPAQQPTHQVQGSNVLAMPAPLPKDPAAPLHLVMQTLDMTDDSNAMELIRQHGDRLRYDVDRGRWLVWDTHRWATQPGNGGQARELAKSAARKLPDDGPEGASKHLKHKRYTLSDRGTTAMLNTARTDSTILVNSDDLDAHPMELNTPGGIVNLETGKLQPADPARMHTRATTVTPDAGADTHVWDTFLASTFPEAEVREYVQRLVGHSLLGEVRAHVLPFAYGSGGNGKGVFLETMRAVLGTYAGAAPAGFLMSTGMMQHATELADLQGRRFVICSEVNPTDRFDEAKVKSLTGGDTVKARFMRQDFFEFRPTHSLWLMGNDQPQVDSGGDALWRRLRLIPFTHKVAEEHRIDDLQGILAREHGPAVLAWAIAGAVKYLTDGMKEPDVVKVATENYAEATDTIGRFLDDECVLNPSLATSVTTIRAAYEEWCRVNGERPIAGRRFAAQLGKHGVLVGRAAPKGAAGLRMYGGIGLASREDEPSEEGRQEGVWGGY